MRNSVIIAFLLIATVFTADQLKPTSKLGTCGITDVIQVIAVAQKVISDIIRTGEIPETDLASLIQTLIRVADDCLAQHLKEPGTACYEAAYAAELAIIKLEKDASDKDSPFVIAKDIENMISKVNEFATQCVVQSSIEALNGVSAN